MPIPTFTTLPPNPQFNDVSNKLNVVVRELQNLFLSLDSLNVVSLTADHIDAGTINANIVTIRGDYEGGAFIELSATGIRINDGTQDTFIADTSGNVTLKGTIEALAGHIGGFTIEADKLSSDSGNGIIQGGTVIGTEVMTDESGNYPRAVMSSIDALFTAEQSADTFIKMVSSYFGAVALLLNNPTVNAIIQPNGSDLLITTFADFGNIQISAGEDLKLYAAPGHFVRVEAWSTFYSDDDTRTLQQEFDAIDSQIDAKQDAFISTDIIIIGGTASLSDTGITPGTWAKASYDSAGRAYAGFNLSTTDIPTLAQSKITNLTTDLAAKAPLASPALTGNPTAPTQTVNDSSTKLSTTAFANPSASLGTSGHYQLPCGLIEQWGQTADVSVPAGSTVNQTFTFPIPFPNAVYQVLVCLDASGASANGSYANKYTPTLTNVGVVLANTTASTQTYRATVFAKGR